MEALFGVNRGGWNNAVKIGTMWVYIPKTERGG